MRWLTVLPITALTAVLLFCVAAPALVQRAALPLVVVGLVIGVPHGAVDHLVPRWADLITGRRATGALIGAYLSGAGLAAVALVAAPTTAVLVFLLLSAAHFGTAEAAFCAERRRQSVPRPWQRPLTSCAHGATVVGLLLWSRPDEVEPWLRQLAPGAAQTALSFRTPGLLVLGALLLAQFAVALTRVRDEALPLAEQVVLAATFAVAPPLVALGVYFGCWHALRHTGRLLDLARRPDDPDWRGAVRRLITASLLPTATALGAMAGLVLVGDRAPLVFEVAVLLALTFPHSALVWGVDALRAPPWGRPVSAVGTEEVA